MSERSLSVATYAAGASLAAITLVYVFTPTYFLDSDTSKKGGLLGGSKKQGVIGLVNPANDCFINSVLQAIAGLGDLRLYLIREMYRRRVDDAWVYATPVPIEVRQENGSGKNEPDWKTEGLQSGIVTNALKEMLDALNERPPYKKTINATPFLRALEIAFRQRISRQQQDAQEFLQVVAERLCDEYYAGQRARQFARRQAALASTRGTAAPFIGTLIQEKLAEMENGHAISPAESVTPRAGPDEKPGKQVEDERFPMEGMFESQIVCLTCYFKPRPTESTFCTLTLNVPQAASTSLGSCFDGMFKTEYIDDFKCEKCRLLHAIEVFRAQARKSASSASRDKLLHDVERLQATADTNPEKSPPKDIALPDARFAPKRRIARHIRVTSFPKILAIHLSRSIFDARKSQKNSAKVSFPERLPLGGLINQRKYKLLGMVTHRGSHQSGHYESYRRQNVYPPFSNPNTFQPSSVYGKTARPATTPRVGEMAFRNPGSLPSTPEPMSAESENILSTLHLDLVTGTAGLSKEGPSTSLPRKNRSRDAAETSSLMSVTASVRSTLSRITSRTGGKNGSRGNVSSGDSPAKTAVAVVPNGRRKQRQRKAPPDDKWWRISDEKIKEANTNDVLAMQREVYLLFYEMERGEWSSASDS